MGAKSTFKELRKEARERAKEILQQYAEKVEAQGQDEALRWLDSKAHNLIDNALSREDAMGSVFSFTVLMEMAYPLEEVNGR